MLILDQIKTQFDDSLKSSVKIAKQNYQEGDNKRMNFSSGQSTPPITSFHFMNSSTALLRNNGNKIQVAGDVG